MTTEPADEQAVRTMAEAVLFCARRFQPQEPGSPFELPERAIAAQDSPKPKQPKNTHAAKANQRTPVVS